MVLDPDGAIRAKIAAGVLAPTPQAVDYVTGGSVEPCDACDDRILSTDLEYGVRLFDTARPRCSGAATPRKVARKHVLRTARRRVVGIRVAPVSRMRDRTSLRSAPTLLDVMDHVLDKGVIVGEPTSAATEAASTSHIALLDVTVRVDITTDADDALKEMTRSADTQC